MAESEIGRRCTNCGALLASTQVFCRRCKTRVSGTEPLAASSSSDIRPGAAPVPLAQVDASAATTQLLTAPDAAPSRPTPPNVAVDQPGRPVVREQPSGPRRLALGLAALVLVVLIGASGIWIASRHHAHPPTPVVSSTTTAQPSPPPTTVAPPPPPVDALRGQWVVLLATRTNRSQAEGVQHSTPGSAYVINTNDYSSLKPGYWSVALGPYTSGEDAIGYCNDRRLRRNDCFAVLLDNQDYPGTRRYP